MNPYDDEGGCPCELCEPRVYTYAGRERSPQANDGGGQAGTTPAQEDRMKRLVYVCHAYAGDPTANAARVRDICAGIKHTYVPLAPHLLLPWYLDESTERDLAILHCLRLLRAADEVRVFGDVTAGMQLEIEEARKHAIPVVYVDHNGDDPRIGSRGRSGGEGRC